MRALLIGAGLTVLLLAPYPDVVAGSTARAETRASEALLLKCRKAVFRKYGWRVGEGRLGLPREFVVRQVDLCVANGGRIR